MYPNRSKPLLKQLEAGFEVTKSFNRRCYIYFAINWLNGELIYQTLKIHNEKYTGNKIDAKNTYTQRTTVKTSASH